MTGLSARLWHLFDTPSRDCTEPASEYAPAEEPRLKRHSAIVALLVACGPHVPEQASSDACIDCHAAAVDDWAGSRHAVAFANPVFQTSWREERSPWCLTCHAPEQGVGCSTCHGPAPRTCEDCHDFDLPKQAGGEPSGTRAQSTAEEWRASGAAKAGLGCVDCHPPHHPVGGTDAERVRQGVSARVEARGDEVVATLTAEDIGHAFPTGDPFRRLQLTICADLACRRPIATETLERRLERTPDGGWAVARDSRIPPPAEGLVGAKTLVLHAPGARSWQLALYLTDPRHRGELGDLAGYVVATGLVEIE